MELKCHGTILKDVKLGLDAVIKFNLIKDKSHWLTQGKLIVSCNVNNVIIYIYITKVKNPD
jgi:hypothetical protein